MSYSVTLHWHRHPEGTDVVVAHLRTETESWSEWSAEPTRLPLPEELPEFTWQLVEDKDTWADDLETSRSGVS